MTIPVEDGRVPVVYRAQITSQYWDPYEMRELISGTVELGVKYSFLSHIHLQASWSQRYAVDLDVMGQEVVTDDAGTRVRGITTDPATVVQLRSREDGRGQPQVGNWELPVTIADFHESVIQYEKRLASMAGLQTADLLRESGDPRSGYALAVSREAVVRHQRKFGPVYAAADSRLLSLIAKVWNANNPSRKLPETGWRIKHRGVPMTAGEIQQYVSTVLEMLSRGLVTAEWALSRILSVTEGDPDLRASALDQLSEARAQAPDDEGSDEVEAGAEAEAEGSGATEAEAEETEASDGESVDPDSLAASSVKSLNGAQVTSALELVDRVARGQLPRESGVSMLVQFYGLTPDAAEDVMGEVGRTFTPATQEDTDGRRDDGNGGGDDSPGEVPASGEREE